MIINWLPILILTSTVTGDHRLVKRYLLFPRYTQMQCSMGLSVPLVLPRRSINFSLVAQANYYTPYNVSNFTPQTIEAREKSSFFYLGRKTVYKYIMEVLDGFGLDGEQCLLRTICEIHETPMDIQERETLLEKLVHFIFTPSSDLQNVSNKKGNNTEEILTKKLLEAEKLGKNDGDCSDAYPECLVSLADLFTMKFNI
ncbi:uncharacterized protein LOC130443344 [Diorhabda sublineata]|uniref:uncharacterized protein LOC130443344 n=1 Tax=Diorhabda sublineata TaxID=1163346 RepID=UPI0024E136FD|nr:uncharacterized protein LOC130443344 [Diorhabda sublineata]